MPNKKINQKQNIKERGNVMKKQELMTEKEMLNLNDDVFDDESIQAKQIEDIPKEQLID
jgi:hypothetical protein